MNPFAHEVTLFHGEMKEPDDLRVRARLGCGEDIFKIPTLRRLRVELPVKHLHCHELARLRIASLKQAATAAGLCFMEEFVATREEVLVHLGCCIPDSQSEENNSLPALRRRVSPQSAVLLASGDPGQTPGW